MPGLEVDRAMTVEVIDGIEQVPSAQWNRLGVASYPFLRHEFMHAAESTGCERGDTYDGK